MKNELISTVERFWKYHFIIRFQHIEVWCEKFSGSFDTGHRLNINVAYSKNSINWFSEVVNEIEGV